MKTRIISGLALLGLLSVFTACSDSDDNSTPLLPGGNISEEGKGPSAEDQLVLPTSEAFLGDSIQSMLRYSLQTNPVSIVNASTTQNGHIAVMGGYKSEAAVYIYAKADDKSSLSKEEVQKILDKYYDVKSEVNGKTINASVTEKTDVKHEADYQQLRVSMKIFTPQSVSSQVSLQNGSIFVQSLTGPQHTASTTSGAIKYLHTDASSITASSTNGYIAFVNSKASEAMSATTQKGSIQISVPATTKAHLNLSSTTNVTASVLNADNFTGTNTRNLVKGNLNGGGANINASVALGSVGFRWYTANENE